MQTLSWACAPDPCRVQLLTSLPSSSFPQGSFAGLNCFSFSVSSCLFRSRDFWGYFRGWGVKNSPVLIARRCGRRHSQAAAVCPRGCCWKEGAWVQTLSIMQIRSLAFGVCLWLFPAISLETNTSQHRHTLASSCKCSLRAATAHFSLPACPPFQALQQHREARGSTGDQLS